MSKSEIVTLREHLALQEQAAWNGLHAPAIVASHTAITARMQRGAEHILQLIEAGHHEEALRLMDTPDWGAGREPGEMSHYDGVR